MKQPYLSQEREIKKLIKFHENEIERLHESLGDISYNSIIDNHGDIPHREVYGLNKDKEVDQTETIRGMNLLINTLSGTVSNVMQEVEDLKLLVESKNKKTMEE